MDHDGLFKKLLTAFFAEFVELFLPDLAQYMDFSTADFLDKEAFTELGLGDRREADVVVRARVRREQSFFLVHLEHQAQDDTGFAARMFRYFCLFHERYKLPVFPVALLSYQGPLRLEPDSYRVRFPGFEPLCFRFRVVQLNRMDWRQYLGSTNPVATALMTRMRIAPADRRRVKLACVRRLLQARPGLPELHVRLISVFIDQYLQLDAQEELLYQEELKNLPPEERESVMEFTTSWKEEGRREGLEQGLERGLEQGLERGLEQGLQQGLEQGLQQGARQSLLVLLLSRFGTVPAHLPALLQGIHDPDVLVELVRVAGVADSLDAFCRCVPPSNPEQPGS